MINQYAKKGSGVLVSGRLDQRSWEDKATGQKRSRVEIVAEDFNFTGSARDNAGGGSSSFSSANDAVDAGMPDDIPDEEIDLSDVPF